MYFLNIITRERGSIQQSRFENKVVVNNVTVTKTVYFHKKQLQNICDLVYLQTKNTIIYFIRPNFPVVLFMIEIIMKDIIN